jgi:hypothetical protein
MQNTTYVGPGLTSARALSLLEGDPNVDPASRKIVIDSLAAAAEPSLGGAVPGGRKALRTALSWLRGAPGRIKLKERERAMRRPRPGAFQRRRPNAKPFKPWRGSAEAAAMFGSLGSRMPKVEETLEALAEKASA